MPGLRREVGRDHIPVHHVPERGDVIGPAVLIVEVIGVFPDIEAEDRLAGAAGDGFAHARAVLVGGRADGERAIGLFHQPRPAGAETGEPGFGEGFLEGVERAERLVDGRGELAGRGLGPARRDDFPEKRVVGVTAAIVAHGDADVSGHRSKVADQFAERLGFELRLAGERVVEIGDIRLMVLGMVDFHRAGVDVRFERVVGVSEGG